VNLTRAVFFEGRDLQRKNPEKIRGLTARNTKKKKPKKKNKNSHEKVLKNETRWSEKEQKFLKLSCTLGLHEPPCKKELIWANPHGKGSLSHRQQGEGLLAHSLKRRRPGSRERRIKRRRKEHLRGKEEITRSNCKASKKRSTCGGEIEESWRVRSLLH